MRHAGNFASICNYLLFLKSPDRGDSWNDFNGLYVIFVANFYNLCRKWNFLATPLILTFQVVDMYLLSEHTLAATFQLEGVTTWRARWSNLRIVLQRPFSWKVLRLTYRQAMAIALYLQRPFSWKVLRRYESLRLKVDTACSDLPAQRCYDNISAAELQSRYFFESRQVCRQSPDFCSKENDTAERGAGLSP